MGEKSPKVHVKDTFTMVWLLFIKSVLKSFVNFVSFANFKT